MRDLSSILSGELRLDTSVASARSGAEPTYPFGNEVVLELYPQGRSLWGYVRVLWHLRSRRFDYVVGFWAQDNILLAAAFLFSRSRVILAEHNSWFYPSRPVRFLRKLLYRTAWRVLVLNRAELAYYRRYMNNVVLLPNPVPALSSATEKAPGKLILAVGHLIKRKNFADLISAMHRSGLEKEGWQLAIVGAGPEREHLEKMIHDLGLVQTTIHPPTSDIQGWYSRAAITVVCSTVEVFSLVLAEAIQGGAVPVAYAADGPSFILEEFPEHLVPIGDIDALAEAMRSLALSENLEDRGRSIQASVRERFSTHQIADQWKRLLSSSEI